jgi:heme oxygenase (staphylobilin-producing)
MFIAINRIWVEKGHGEQLIARFAASDGLQGVPGIVDFELLQRTWLGPNHGASSDCQAESEEFLSVSRWESEEHFRAWTKSDAFKRAHGQKTSQAQAAAGAEQGGQPDPAAAKPRPSLTGSQATGYAVVVAKEFAALESNR